MKMKTYLKLFLLLLVTSAVLYSCKKEDIDGSGTSSITAEEYTFNKANKTFTPTATVKAQINSSLGIRFVYCYLIRTNTPDSLIYVSDNTQDNPKEYTLDIPMASFPISNMSKATGVKLMAKQTNNSSIEGFVKITFFDPALPALTNFATSIAANLAGGNTAITGKITSAYGIQKVDIYDDYKTENTYELSASITDMNGAKDYNLNYAYQYRKAAQHIKVVATDIYGQSAEIIIPMPVDLAAFKPIFFSFATSVSPSLVAPTPITGTITSVTGLKRIDVYDDYQGSYVLVTSLTPTSGALTYNMNYNYTYRRRAFNIKLVAFDTDDLQTEKVIPLNINYQSNLYRDVYMTAHTTGTNSIFFMDNGTTKGNCDLNASEPTMSFLYYGAGNGPSFYSPTNTSTVATNFKCGTTSWVVANSSSLRATRFRVLVPGTPGIDNIYAQFNAGTIDNIDDAFFAANSVAVPGGSTARFDPVATPTTGIYNTTTAYLIWVRVPDATGGTFKNGLIRVKENTSTTGTSTTKFDIYVQK
jgi:hypothetical protein